MTTKIQKKTQNKVDDYQFLIDTLKNWGISIYTGVTGGGVIHLLKHLCPYNIDHTDNPEFFTLAEYGAGFAPLGYYLASGKMAAAVATTGAATKLITCGLTDAKMHDIPAVYIVPLSEAATIGLAPLQDTSSYGNHIIEQLEAELPDGVFILDDQSTLPEQLTLAKAQLDKSKPVVFVLVNGVLNMPIKQLPIMPEPKHKIVNDIHLEEYITELRKASKDKRIVIFVGEEMARYHNATKLTTKLSEELKAAVVWSINGANAVDRDNEYGYGYISFGGNDESMALYGSLGENDVLLILGACPDEYTVNLKKFTASHTFYMGSIPNAYGMIGNSLKHTAEGKYHQIIGPLDKMVKKLIEAVKKESFVNKAAKPAPENLNNKPLQKARKEYVDMSVLYQKLDEWWPKNSVGFDDVCIAYKDRQYVVQRPNNNIQYYSLYRGSAMGGAYGAAVGAKLADPKRPVFLFTGDGCFRLFGASMGEVRHLGLVMFVINNETLAIVEQGLGILLPDTVKPNYHADIDSIDYCGLARACGWDAEKLNPDLSNLNDILKKMGKKEKRSLLIEIPVDAKQLLGSNPRLNNL